MGRLHKNVKKYSLGSRAAQSILGKDTYESLHPLGESAEAAYDSKKASEKALKDAAEKPVIPVPDEEALERARRKRNARGGGRASTVMTSGGAGYGG